MREIGECRFHYFVETGLQQRGLVGKVVIDGRLGDAKPLGH
jgi:hypothetical protein